MWLFFLFSADKSLLKPKSHEQSRQRTDFIQRTHVLGTLDGGMKYLKRAVVASFIRLGISLINILEFSAKKVCGANIILASNSPSVASGVIIFTYLLNLYARFVIV